MEKQIKIALAGNPNCGKTTLFNALTGSNQFVGNWPGVTVEKKEGKLKKHDDVIIMDLPGIYSLSPYTLEEVVARNYPVSYTHLDVYKRQVNDSVTAYVRQDVALAERVMAADDTVDDYFDRVKRSLISPVARGDSDGEGTLDILLSLIHI